MFIFYIIFCLIFKFKLFYEEQRNDSFLFRLIYAKYLVETW